MRLFVAIDLPAAEKTNMLRALERVAAPDLPIRWLAAESLHITLKFLGEVESARLAGVEDALRRAAAQTRAFELTIGQFGAFPSLGRPDIFWLGVQPSDALLSLQQAIEAAYEPLGFAREPRAFRPHITVGRRRGREPIRARARLDRMAREIDYQGTIAVDAVQLMRSHTEPKGARYETLANVELN